MRAMISSCGRFHSHHAAFELYRRNALQLYVTSYKERRLPPDKIKCVPLIDTLHRGLRQVPLVRNTIPLNLIKKRFFDQVAQRYVDGCDLVHVHSALQPNTIRRARMLGIPTIVDRGVAHPVYQHRILSEERARFAPHLPPFYKPFDIEHQIEEFEMADWVMVNSSYVYDTFVAQGFDPEKLVLLSQGVDVSAFRPVEKQDDVFRVLTVGLLFFRKGTHYLLQAFHELDLPNAELVLVGAPRPEMRPVLAQYEGIFTHVPGVPHEELYRTYSNASVFVLVSLDDGFPNVVIEAMACGVPVVISENVGVRDIVRDGVDGFVIPICDVTALQERLMTLRENPDLCRQMGTAARQRAVQFTWKRYGDQLVREYERLSSSKG